MEIKSMRLLAGVAGYNQSFRVFGVAAKKQRIGVTMAAAS